VLNGQFTPLIPELGLNPQTVFWSKMGFEMPFSKIEIVFVERLIETVPLTAGGCDSRESQV
jgi:hypothetical protein